ncbi:MAG: endonuclease/exonuclease/phosphatase family protein [Bacteroidetes bacterium]|nr:endonuclease/exonuclease/phosphatase family protein [Rhodothermia bacterium]MCS7155560.1 endonuclease/exonuclease/phosphatase family protein [Bacteroidota bacterium]MCX7906418.1 endonuclease/exonuclease/phosphatase family protein [Bacteroidota bacterium]MDW8137300.1 endonuclease/exonuclease/phosphatase family protein [Bacteroidota bacterium]MDW8284830.1 endonuclease/exonuclease/phosphatase family protein [Bacteroidota bacterium]
MRIFLYGAALLWATGVLGAWASLYVLDSPSFWEALWALSLPAWALLGLGLLLWAALARRWGIAALALLCGAGTLLQAGWRPWGPEEVRDTQAAFGVLSWNVHGAASGFAPVLEAILRDEPDLVLLQEVQNSGPALIAQDPIRYGDFRHALRAHGYHVAFAPDRQEAWASYGLLVASRWPFVRVRRLNLGGRPGSGLMADVAVQGRIVRLITVHLYTTGSEKPWRGAFSWDRWRTWLSQMRYGWRARGRELEELLAIVNRSPYPVLLAGDFNTTPFDRYYVRLRRVLRDAHRTAGWGWGGTYSAAKPLLRIDYQWYTAGLRPLTLEAKPTWASDHRPLLGKWTLWP